MADLQTHAERSNGTVPDETGLDHVFETPTQSGVSGVALINILLRRWRLLTVCAVISAILGYFVGQHFCLRAWRAEGTLLYTPFPIPDNLRGVYSPPSSQTLITLVKSPHNLEKLRQEFGLRVPIKTMDTQFKVTQPQNAEMISISLDWAEPGTGAALINHLMKVHIDHVAELRKQNIQASVKNLQESLARSQDKLAKARVEFRSFEERSKVQNIALELDRLQREASGLEQSLALPRGNLRNLQNQLAKLNEYLDAVATGRAAGMDPPDSGDKTLQTRRTSLRDQLQSMHFKHLESIKTYEAKLQNYNSLKKQFQLRIVGKADYDQAKADLELARQQRDNNVNAMEKFKEEIRDLPLAYARARKGELQEQIIGAREDIANTEAAVKSKRQEANEMGLLLKQADPITKHLKDSEDEVQQIDGQLVALQRMYAHQANEFVVETPAVPLDHATASNRKKLTLATFSLPMLLVIGFVIVYDRRALLAQYLQQLQGYETPAANRVGL
jgi:capsular polysaccharide biosynthesis protein